MSSAITPSATTANTAFRSAGLHHVTLITRKVQPNVDFYAGFLGLSLVKRTAGFEDAQQLHLFYGDAAGARARSSPSSSGRMAHRAASATASRWKSPSPSAPKRSASG